VSFPSVPSTPPSYPPYGSILDTYSGYSYPNAQGGTTFNWDSQNWENQTVSVNLVADGSGGSFIDWSSVTNIAYKGVDTFFHYKVEPHDDGNSDLEVPSGSGNYFVNDIIGGYNGYHDGSGGFYTMDAGGSTSRPYGYVYTEIANQIEVPEFSGNYYNNGRLTRYTSDGNYGYTSSQVGDYFANGTYFLFIGDGTFSENVEVPGGSMNYYPSKYCGNDYYWNGVGGYYTSGVCKHYDYGTFIMNDGSYNYYWDGSGGYYNA
jgi:hypothetical protein